MRIAATGFVSEKAGSVASANALFLIEMLRRGHEIDFFSKMSFVDPRQSVGNHPGFRFIDCTNSWQDQLRRLSTRIPVLSFVTERFDSYSYHKLLCKTIRREATSGKYDVCLWLGDYAKGRVDNLKNVSFAQGPPGTDARSILRQRQEVLNLAGKSKGLWFILLSALRISRIGTPSFKFSDHVIVGSRQSKKTLIDKYQLSADRITILPYPIDTAHFSPPAHPESNGLELRVIWLGRIVPRKRLDVFLKGAEIAIGMGVNVHLTLVGCVGFVPGYDRLVAEFLYPERISRLHGISRDQVPSVLAKHDVLAQPSDEENFGSSVAEAQACGITVVVGHSNGNSDYLTEDDIHLPNDSPEAFATALDKLYRRKSVGSLGNSARSRALAIESFSLQGITAQLIRTLEQATKDGVEPRDIS